MNNTHTQSQTLSCYYIRYDVQHSSLSLSLSASINWSFRTANTKFHNWILSRASFIHSPSPKLALSIFMLPSNLLFLTDAWFPSSLQITVLSHHTSCMCSQSLKIVAYPCTIHHDVLLPSWVQYSIFLTTLFANTCHLNSSLKWITFHSHVK
jgi:hypothetical protein